MSKARHLRPSVGAASARSLVTVVLGLFLVTLGLPTLPAAAITAANAITYVYDELGRLEAVVDPGQTNGIAKYSYDGPGNLLSITRQSVTTTTIIDFHPKTAKRNTTVTIYGVGFSSTPGSNTVKFGGSGGTAATVTSATTTQLAVTVPSSEAVDGSIFVSSPSGSQTSTQQFTLDTSAAPTITGFTPTAAASGATVTVTGTGFDPSSPDRNNVFFSGIRAQVTAATATSLSVLVPPFTTRGKISVQTAFGEATSSDDFVVPPLGVNPSQLETVIRTTVGTPTTLSISMNGNVSIAMFDGTEGQRIFLNISNSTICFANMALRDPFGRVVGSTFVACDGGYIDTMKLPVNGTYSVVMDQAGGSSTGSATFTMYDVPPDPTPQMTIGGPPENFSFTVPGQNARPTFEGTANQTVRVTFSNVSMSACNVSILDPDGVPLVSTPICNNGAFIETQLPATATYTIVVDPTGPRTGDITLTLTQVGGGGQPLTARPVTTETVVRLLSDEPVPSAEQWVPDLSNPANWMSGRPTSPYELLPPLMARRGVTALSGTVLRLDGRPLPGVNMSLGNASTTTDETGRFLLSRIPGGSPELEIDGRTASTAESTYGEFHAAVKVHAGRTNVLAYTTWMPKLDLVHAVHVASPTRRRIVVRSPFMPGLMVVIPKGTVIRDEDGNTVHQISLTPIPVDRPPYPLFANPLMYFTLQPDGAQILPSGARIIYPNYAALPAGTKHPLFVYEPDEGGWESYGYGRVSNDGRRIVPGPGARLERFTGTALPVNAWVPAALDAQGNDFGDPVDASTGLFDYEKTDFVLPGPMPIRLTRYYRQDDWPVAGFPQPNKYMFGSMMATNYEAYLYNPDAGNNPPLYKEMNLIMPGDRRVKFTKTSQTLPDTNFVNVVFQATTTPGPFYKSTIQWQNGWILTRTDGTVYSFGFAPNLGEIKDRFGNRVMVLGPGGSAPNPTSPSFYNPISQIVSYPSGRWLSFSYTNQLVTQVTDNLGRAANYTYDGSLYGRMVTATDPNQSGQQNPKPTTYTWQGFNCKDLVMRSVTDPRQIPFLTNTYTTDTTCRVTSQAVPGNTHLQTNNYVFAYTPTGPGSITQTDITDPNSNVSRETFDATGYPTTETVAFGTPQARTFTYTLDPSTHRTSSVTDSFHSRRTDYGFDNFGSLTSVTRLAGTTSAVTTSYTYDPVFQQLQTIQDPLTHTTRFDYDTKGCLDVVTDPMSRQTLLDCNSTGEITSITDPLTHQTQLAYAHGDLTTVTDPLSRSTSRFTDAGGRVLSVIDPLSYSSAYAYDNQNQLTKLTDAKGKAISFFYDDDGNLIQVKDERNASPSTTNFAYNDQNLLQSRTDPLSQAESFTHDNNGNQTLWTDRKGQVTEFRYDALNQVTFAGFNRTGSPPNYSYTSTINYTHDVGGRLTSIADSTVGAGTITRGYDDLDRLTSEIQANAVSPGILYTYWDDGTRKSMTVPNQSQINYGYNNNAQLTSLTQASTTVSMSYFSDGRPQTLSLKPAPTPVTEGYSYDAGGQLSQITYTHGASTDDLSYGYDQTGRRTGVFGTYGRTGLPAATSATAVYDLANKLTSWNGATVTNDNNGNLTNDGTFAYTYNARNQLTLVKQGNQTRGSFIYDGVGRRVSRTVGNSTTKPAYDGWNLAQERASNNSVSANYLTGLGLDQPLLRIAGSTTNYYLTDAIGSIVGLATTTGTVPTTYTYDPYGKTTAAGTSSGSFLGFTGRDNDSTGTLSLYNYRFRAYSPTLQRFLGEDPAGIAGGDVNLYQYVSAAPTVSADPLGLKMEWGGYAPTSADETLVPDSRKAGQQNIIKNPGRCEAQWSHDSQFCLTQVPPTPRPGLTWLIRGACLVGAALRWVWCRRGLVPPPSDGSQGSNGEPSPSPSPTPKNNTIELPGADIERPQDWILTQLTAAIVLSCST